jgi:hypothetical protein
MYSPDTIGLTDRWSGQLALRDTLQYLPGAAAAALHAASIGVATGVLGCIMAGNLAFGMRSGLVGFVLGAATLGYATWRSIRARRSAFLDRWYHDDPSAPSLDEALTYIRFTDQQRANAKGRR